MSAVGTPTPRVEGIEKVTGRARYAVEYPVENVAYVWPVLSTIARGRVLSVGDVPGTLAVLWHGSAPRLGDLGDRELAVLQDDRVAYRGQIVAAVVAGTLEAARAAADALPVEYAPEPHDVELTWDHPKLYTPDTVNPAYEADVTQGDPAAELAAAAVTVDVTYTTAAQHNNPLEPHATTAQWDGDRLTVHDSNQGVAPVVRTLRTAFGLAADQVRVVAPHVGGGFGSKGTPRPNVILAAMAARVAGRPVRLALHRHHLFSVTGYRTPTIQRIRLGADPDGRLRAIVHEAVEQSSTLTEYAEQTTVGTRMMYAAPARRTAHRLARLDVPTPSWMRAPGEAPGMAGLECAMDELAVALGLDPIELRVRNDPAVDPESGHPFSSRNLVACLREGAERFGWAGRDPAPGVRRDGRWLVGTGVAAATYPARSRPSSARVRADRSGRFTVELAAADIGTGARTAIRLVAADALGVPVERVEVRIGDSALPPAGIAGGSMGMASWAWAVTKAGRQLRGQLLDGVPAEGLAVTASTSDDVKALDESYSRHGFGAQFAEVRVDVDSGEIRVARMLGVFACGRIVNPTTARSQLLGGMIWGMSTALLEESTLDTRFGDYANHDLAEYHVPACADAHAIEAYWLDERDDAVNPAGIKGIGEIGIVGAASAVTNAIWHATGVRVRKFPVKLEDVRG